jgi:hypothetical protein
VGAARRPDGKPAHGPHPQFAEVTFDIDQPEGQIVEARIMAQRDGQLQAQRA